MKVRCRACGFTRVPAREGVLPRYCGLCRVKDVQEWVDS